MSLLESFKDNINKGFATISFNTQLLSEPEDIEELTNLAATSRDRHKLEVINHALKQIDLFSNDLVCLNSWKDLQQLFPGFEYSDDYTAKFAFRNVMGEVYKSDDGFIILDPKVTIYDEESVIVEDFNLAKVMDYSIKQENETEVTL